jgi:hypothetical protein
MLTWRLGAVSDAGLAFVRERRRKVVALSGSMNPRAIRLTLRSTGSKTAPPAWKETPGSPVWRRYAQPYGPLTGQVMGRGGGVGVLISPEVSGEIWTNFSHREIDGYRTLEIDQAVEVDWEHCPAGQDGYVYRAQRVHPVS